MADTVCDCFSYIVASTFMALWQMFGDGMGDRGRSFAEVESPCFIFGGAVRLRQARVLAHVLGPGSRAGRCASGPFQPPERLHELGETHNVSFRPGSRHFTGGRGGEENMAGGVFAGRYKAVFTCPFDLNYPVEYSFLSLGEDPSAIRRTCLP